MHNKEVRGKRTILLAVLTPMFVLLLAEVGLLMGILWNSGITARIDTNDIATMDRQVQTRSDFVMNRFETILAETDALAETINSQAAELRAQQAFDPHDIATNNESCTRLLNSIVPSMITSLRGSETSGVFVILNSDDLSKHSESGAYGNKPGVFIGDADPTNTASPRNDDLTIECASTEIISNHGLTTGRNWTPSFNFAYRTYPSEHDYLYKPYQTAYDAETPSSASEYGYWSMAMIPSVQNRQLSLTYSQPLILDDGTVYGVVGFDATTYFLSKLLPYNELIDLDEGSYMIARTTVDELAVSEGGFFKLDPLMCVGYSPIENAEYGHPFTMVRGTGSSSSYHSVNGQYYISADQLKLYKSNAPFSNERWMLLGLMPRSALHQFSNQVLRTMGMAVLFMLLLGFVGSIVAAYGLARPLRKLSDEVKQADLSGQKSLNLSATGITEVDQLTDAISTLSQKVEKTSMMVQERLEYERDFDLLTGLMNRRAFYRRGEEIFSQPDALKQAAIVMLDLDNLKTYNDSYGHDCGDKYISTAAQCFQHGVPANVIVSRVSGDEFFLLFYGYDSHADIDKDIEHMWEEIQKSEFVLPDGKHTHIAASGGVALYLEDSSEFAELMKLADFTMYQAKESGKNNIAYFDFDTYQERSSAIRIENNFNELMGDFSLAHYHFQPIFDAHTGEPFAYEALMRVSVGLLKSPFDVIEIARKSDRLMEIERMTWTRTIECYEQLKSHDKLSEAAYLFVNSFGNLSLSEDELSGISKQHAQSVHNMVIEITENVDMDEGATALKRDMPGFSGFFALDDYRSGYNSELKLLTLCPKFVKVDITIIRDIHLSPDKQRIVSQIVEYGHERDMLIVAEGIETAEELNTLLELDVDLFQGYYLARPAAEPLEISDEAALQIMDFAERKNSEHGTQAGGEQTEDNS